MDQPTVLALHFVRSALVVIMVRLWAIAWGLSALACGLADETRAAADDVAVLRDLRYRPGSVQACTLDLAMPTERGQSPRPAIVVIHGGGWLEGDKSSFSTTDKRAPANILDFAKAGFVAVTINYRLSGEAPFPAALDDCRSAIRWLRAHAGEYHVDADHVGAYGNSAGGHLALLLGLMPPPATPGRNEPYAEQSSGVQAVVSDSGPLDLVAGHEQNQLRTAIEKLMGGPPDGPRRADYQRASPVSYVVAADTADGARTTPPLLLIYGVVDNQVNVSTADAFVTALGRSGHKDVSYFRLANVDHCPHSLVRIPYLRQVVVEFFQRTLKPSPAQGLQTCLLPPPATWEPIRLWGCRPFAYHARPGAWGGCKDET